VTPKQTEHLMDLLSEGERLKTIKYVRGVQEHGGNLWEKSAEDLLDEAISENIDQFFYLMTLKQVLTKARTK
jgi:hypothetical protein